MTKAAGDRENASEQRARLRRTARLSAVQALYQMELTGAGAKAVVLQFRNHKFGYDDEPGDYIESDEDFFEDLLNGIVARQDEVDSSPPRSSRKAGSIPGWTPPCAPFSGRAAMSSLRAPMSQRAS